jgi:nitroreductase
LENIEMSVYETIIKRRSIRRFKDIPIPRETLERCVNVARLAPSAANLQPLEYIVIDNGWLLSQVFSTLKWAAYISPEGHPPQSKRPRTYIVILKNRDIGVPSSSYDIGAAIENMILVALEEGIGSCPIASVDRDKLREILNIPGDYEISLVLALGYPDESPVEESFEGSVKYWKDKDGVLHVPKKKLETVLHWNSF